MKRSVALTAASLIALTVAAGAAGRLNAETNHDKAQTATVSEQISGGPDARQGVEMSEHGLAAVNDIHLARIAVNDGYVDNAKKLLDDAKTLLKQVKDEDKPVTVTAEVKEGGKPAKKETTSEQPDMIPILAKMQVVEGYVASESDHANASDADHASASEQKSQPEADANAKAGDKAPETASASDKPTAAERATAVAQARQQLSNGDRKGAAETLRLVDLGLVSQVVSMPLKDTTQHVDKALALIDDGKLHEANLELKQVKDALVVDTSIVVEPATAAAMPAHQGGKIDGKSGGKAGDKSANAG